MPESDRPTIVNVPVVAEDAQTATQCTREEKAEEQGDEI
jgi:hypothetical protein